MENNRVNAVEEQAKRADELHKAAYPEKYADKDGGKPSEKPAEEGKTPEKAPGITQPTKIDDTDDYKQKYLVLQGKYNAEVPRLTSEMNRLRGEVEALKSAPPKVKEEEKPSNIDEAMKLLQEEYGEEFTGRINTMITSQVSAALSKVNAGKPPEPPAAIATESSEEAFWTTISDQVPDWAVVNDEKEWRLWLGNKDITGETYQQVLDRMSKGLNAAGVVAIFNNYKAFKKATVSAKEGELLKHLQPEGGPSGNKPSNEGRVYTKAEIARYYDDVRRGNYDGRDPDRVAMENDIFKAQTDGRVSA